MLDDDFKEIEDFLKVGGNTELQTFNKFEEVVDEFIANKFTDDLKENFSTLNLLVYHSYGEFEKYNNDLIKDFAITIIVIKKLIAKLKNLEENTILSEEDKKMYLQLMQMLMESFKKEAASHLNFFNIFSEYIESIDNIISNKD